MLFRLCFHSLLARKPRCHRQNLVETCKEDRLYELSLSVKGTCDCVLCLYSLGAVHFSFVPKFGYYSVVYSKLVIPFNITLFSVAQSKITKYQERYIISEKRGLTACFNLW